MAIYEYYDFYDHLVKMSEKRAKVDPRTFWYMPRNSTIGQYIKERTQYLYVDARNVPFNKCKDLIEMSSNKKVAIHTYFDVTSSRMLANIARLKGCDVIIEFAEHASEI